MTAQKILQRRNAPERSTKNLKNQVDQLDVQFSDISLLAKRQMDRAGLEARTDE